MQSHAITPSDHQKKENQYFNVNETAPLSERPRPPGTIFFVPQKLEVYKAVSLPVHGLFTVDACNWQLMNEH